MLRTAVYGDDQRMDLLGSRGMIIADNRKPHVVKRFAVKTVKASEPYQIAFHERYNEAFMAGIDGIVDCVEKAATPLACFEDGRRALYAIGGNEDAARAAGINVDRVIWLAFIFAAVLAGLAGILMTGRLDLAVITQGQGIIFSVFAAAVIGGVSLGGGRGAVVGLVSFVLLNGVIYTLATLAQVPSFYVQAAIGAVIVVAAVLTTIASRRSSGFRTRS